MHTVTEKRSYWNSKNWSKKSKRLKTESSEQTLFFAKNKRSIWQGTKKTRTPNNVNYRLHQKTVCILPSRPRPQFPLLRAPSSNDLVMKRFKVGHFKLVVKPTALGQKHVVYVWSPLLWKWIFIGVSGFHYDWRFWQSNDFSRQPIPTVQDGIIFHNSDFRSRIPQGSFRSPRKPILLEN